MHENTTEKIVVWFRFVGGKKERNSVGNLVKDLVQDLVNRTQSSDPRVFSIDIKANSRKKSDICIR